MVFVLKTKQIKKSLSKGLTFMFVTCLNEQLGFFLSGEFLLDEEGTQVCELPGACNAQNDELHERPSYDAGVDRLGLIAEFNFSFLFGVHNWWGSSLAFMHSNPEGSPLGFSLRKGVVKLTLWKTCSRRISINLAFKSLTF